MVETSDGGYAVVGFTSSISVGEGGLLVSSADFWFVKTDVFGNMEWNQTYGGAGNDEAFSLVATSDGGYAIAGRTNSFGDGEYDCWLVKTDASGNMLWNSTCGEKQYASETYGTTSEWAHSLVEASDGGYVMAGMGNYTIFVGGDVWLAKTDEFGNMEWNHTYGGTWHDEAFSLVEASDGGYALAGSTQLTNSTDFWLVKTDEFGNMEWNHTYGGPGEDVEIARALVEASDGGYVLTGTAESVGDSVVDSFWLVKTDAAGNMEWNQTKEKTGYEMAYSLIATSDGGYAMAGSTYSPSTGDSDFWLVKTDEFGNAPEAPWVVLPLLVTATLAILISKKKLLNNHEKSKCIFN